MTLAAILVCSAFSASAAPLAAARSSRAASQQATGTAGRLQNRRLRDRHSGAERSDFASAANLRHQSGQAARALTKRRRHTKRVCPLRNRLPPPVPTAAGSTPPRAGNRFPWRNAGTSTTLSAAEGDCAAGRNLGTQYSVGWRGRQSDPQSAGHRQSNAGRDGSESQEDRRPAAQCEPAGHGQSNPPVHGSVEGGGGDGDLERARTLAWKAQLLSEELVKPQEQSINQWTRVTRP